MGQVHLSKYKCAVSEILSNTSTDTKGFCQVEKIPKIREKLGSGGVGQAPTRIFWPIRVFLGFLDFFNLTKTPNYIQ